MEQDPTRSNWIIGATSGIGRTLALALARNGETVIASGRRTQYLASLETSGSMLSGRLKTVPVDVTDLNSVSAAFQWIVQTVGCPTRVFINAGIYLHTTVENFQIENYRRTFDVNVLGTARVLDTILPTFIERKHGEILITSSLAAYRGLPTAAPYGASKAALLNMAESLAPELGRNGISLRVISPGFIKTPMTAENTFHMPLLMSEDAAVQAIMKELPLRSFEIAFPKRLAWFVKTLRWIPNRWYQALLRRLIRRTSSDRQRPA